MNAFAFVWNCYARWLPVIAQISLFTSLISFFVILVTVPAKASSHQDARFVFANFVNETGWNQNGIGTLLEFKRWLERLIVDSLHFDCNLCVPSPISQVSIRLFFLIAKISLFCYKQ